MFRQDPTNQTSLFDKALYLHQYASVINSYSKDNLKYTVYLIDDYRVEVVYNITHSQIQDVIIKEKVNQIK